MASALEIVRGISAVMGSKSHDGALDDKGERIEIGLKREEGCMIKDSRVMDGFKVKISGDKLCVTYQTDVKLAEVHDSKFESNMEKTIADIVKFLKKEYKGMTKNTLALTKEGEIKVDVQYVSRVRTCAVAQCWYKIGGMTDQEDVNDVKSPAEKLDGSIKDWLAVGKDQYPGTKKPENVSRKGKQ